MKKTFVFAVQGEGRGHLTQAIATYEMLTARGHNVAAVMIGSSCRREIPAFVKEKIKAPVITFHSPNFVTDKNNKSIQLGKTICKNLLQWKKFRKSIQLIREVVDIYQPDLLVNFYEPLIGISSVFKKLNTRIVSAAHQFIYLHPGFSFPEGGRKTDRYAIKKYTQLTARGSDKLLALSFYPLQQQQYKNIIVSPPLLRKELFNQEVFTGNHLLVYILNAGYMQDIINWHKKNPEVEIHCFTDSKSVKGKWRFDDTLCFHSLDDQKFLQLMASAKALVTTAGFESVCEAMYLGKPVLMVPVKGHFEQWCNARDGAKAGAGTYADEFNLDVVLHDLSFCQNRNEQFVQWTKQTTQLMLQTFSEVLQQPGEIEQTDSITGSYDFNPSFSPLI